MAKEPNNSGKRLLNVTKPVIYDTFFALWNGSAGDVYCRKHVCSHKFQQHIVKHCTVFSERMGLPHRDSSIINT